MREWTVDVRCVVRKCLEHFQQLYVKDEGGVGRDRVASSVFAVGEVIGEIETVLGTLFHQLHALGPAGNDLVETEVCGLVTLVGTVEDGAVNQGPMIVAANSVSGFGGSTCAFL